MQIPYNLINAKKGAFKSTDYGIVEAAELEYAQSILKGNKQTTVTFTYTDGVESSSVSGISLNYKGTKPKNGTVSINSSGEIAIAIHDGKYCAEKGYGANEVTISEKTVEECQISGDVEEPIAPNFIKTFGGWNEDRFLGVSATSNGYIAVGYSYSVDGDLLNIIKGFQDAIIVKYDLNGNIIWKKNFGGMDSDGFNDVIMANNGYVFVGFSRSKEDDLDGIDTMAWDALIFRSDLNGNR